MERVLADIGHLLARERELFGEDILSEPRASLNAARGSAPA
ncbi:MAG: hypothetical protein H6Q29_457, partial [Bacteroidetes bacterium]|nr:hypothetical protein [Bacteroidota bacterium]